MYLRATKAACFLIAIVTLARCGSSVAIPAASFTPTTPSPTTDLPANVAGNWTGTLQAQGFDTLSISLMAVQGGSCVDGAWHSDDNQWVGAISGLAGAASYSGLVSIQRPADGPGKCSGVGNFSGEVGADAIKWTSNGFSGDCAGGLPQSVTILLHRQ